MAKSIWWKRLLALYTVPASADVYVRPAPEQVVGVTASGTHGVVTPKAAATGEQTGTGMVASGAAKIELDAFTTSIATGYMPTGGYDELRRANGSIGAHWQPLLAGLDALSHAQRLERIEQINTRVRETGIAHDLFADPDRHVQPWRLDLMPIVFSADAWSQIERAVIQRARLFEALLADVYGAQNTLKSGQVPSQLVFSDPSYLRACQNLAVPGGRIQFFAVDLARGPDGSFHVVDTHVETPAGIGYALANRTVLSHVSGDLFKACKAIRLAPFFQQMQDSLAHRANRADPRIALLTPGPHHEDFFSHSYLARYLGLLLVEGDDLRVDNGRVHLKTLSGLQPIDLMVRCVAGAMTDALELDPAGFLGPVGLVQATHQHAGLVVNALGTALAENRGLGGYLPALCKSLLGEDLAIWDVKKWWLGDAKIRKDVITNLDCYFIRRAFEQTARPGHAEAPRDPALLSKAARAALIEELEFGGAGLIAEEKTPLATTPSYTSNGLEPTSYAMRVFATATPNGFVVMPGGLAMAVNPGEALALTSPDGASRDVWVVSEAPQPPFRSLWRPPLGDGIDAQYLHGASTQLPSRAADNLFWLGRYIEYADWTFRVLRTCLSRLEDDNGPHQNLALMRATLNAQLERDGALAVTVPPGLDDAQAIATLGRALATSTDRASALPQILAQVHRIASLTRDRLSLESWRTLNAFYTSRRWEPQSLPDSVGQTLDLIDAGLRVVAAFNGLSHENMTRNFGWSFLDMGRRITRAQNLSQVLGIAFERAETGEDNAARLLFVLELADSFITYRSRYRLTPMVAPVLELLISDETNPRSLGFQIAALSTHVEVLPQAGPGRGRTEAQRIVLAMINDIRLADVVKLAETEAGGRRPALSALLESHTTQLPQLTDALTRRYFSVIEKEPKWARAKSRLLP